MSALTHGSMCPFPPPAAAGHEGEGEEALLQGHRARPGDDPHRRLRRLPVGRPAEPAFHRPHPEHVGIMGQQHGCQGQLVLPSGGDEPRQEAHRQEGERFAEQCRGRNEMNLHLIGFCVRLIPV